MTDSNEKDAIINTNKIYKIESKVNPDLVLEIEKGGRKNETKIILGKSIEVTYQFFKISIKKDTNLYNFESIHCKNKMLDVNESKAKNGGKLQIYENNGTNAQLFRIIDVGEGYYNIVTSLDNNYCIDVKYGGKEAGTNVWIYQRNNSDPQKFKLVGKNFLNFSVEYAVKFAKERNPNYKVYEPNCTNFCSQCLVAGGVDEDDIWTKDSAAFIDPTKFREFFIKKEVEFKESPKIDEIKAGDIIFTQEKEKFDHPMFVMRTSIDAVIYCSNSKDVQEGSFKINLVTGVLKTSSLFK